MILLLLCFGGGDGNLVPRRDRDVFAFWSSFLGVKERWWREIRFMYVYIFNY